MMKPDDRDFDLPIIYLLPGDLYIARQPAIISTILGSCISICLYAPYLRIGAMCHCLLPFSSQTSREGMRTDFKSVPIPCGQPYRYLDQAVAYMLLKMEEMGITRNKLFAQIFGGSDMFKTGSAKRNGEKKRNVQKRNVISHLAFEMRDDIPFLSPHSFVARPGLQRNGDTCSNSIGNQNIKAAKAILQAYHVPIKKEDLGGDRGRKIFFDCSTGEVLVKKIGTMTRVLSPALHSKFSTDKME